MNTDAEIIAGAGRMRFAVGTAQASSIQAIRHVAGRAIVAGGDDTCVFGYHRSDTVAYTIGTTADGDGDSHQVFIHVGARTIFGHAYSCDTLKSVSAFTEYSLCP